ncbi:MAG: tetratricopeptide repeat protein [Bacteroidota bacterium]
MDEDLKQEIESFLNGEGTEAERTDFMDRLKHDEEIRAYVQEIGLMEHAAKMIGRQEMKRQLIEQTQANSVSAPIWKRPVVLVAAVAAVLMLVMLAGMWDRIFPPTPDELYSKYFEMEPPGSLRNDGHTTWNEAMEAYTRQDIQEARTVLIALTEDSSLVYRQRAYLYMGICEMLLDNDLSALSYFQQIPEVHLFYPKAHWYQALVYLRLQDLPSARKVLEQIREDSGHPKQKEAVALLEELPE